MKQRIAFLIKHNTVIQKIYRVIFSAVFKFIGIFIKTDDKLILFSSFGGDQYSDSPRAIFEAMKRDSRFKNYRFVWAFAAPENFNDIESEKVKIDSFSYFKTALKAKIWITNVNIERGLSFKKKNQIYLNTWHGTGPKKSGNAIKSRKDYDFSCVDIMCADGEYVSNVFKTWFKAREENILYCGRPREDELFKFDDNTKKQVRNKLNIPESKKVLLYMPTWRENGNKELNYELWEKSLSDKYVLLVRLHHFEKEVLVDRQSDFLIDVSQYSNVNELYWISDILISDYSSAFFDYGLLGKPMICFGYDYEEYEKETGFFMDLKGEFPGGIKYSDKEVVSFIQNIDYETESERCKKYVKKYVKHYGNATQQCLDKLEELLNR